MPIGTLKDIRPENKTVLLRLDLNSPIDPTTHHILDDKRFREHIPTIQALSGSRVVIVTHQSRPGKKDFTTLEGHAERLEGLLQRKVRYIDDIFGQCARDAVRKMKNGDVLMLENVRFNAEENLTLNPDEASKTYIARKLSQMADIFVNDAFGTSHRSQPTMVGLPMVMRSVAGLLMEKEVATLSRVFENAPGPVCMVLGGTKVDDSLSVAEHVLPTRVADLIIVTGVVGNVFLRCCGVPDRGWVLPDYPAARLRKGGQTGPHSSRVLQGQDTLSHVCRDQGGGSEGGIPCRLHSRGCHDPRCRDGRDFVPC